jgi:hypothetical protein
LFTISILACRLDSVCEAISGFFCRGLSHGKRLRPLRYYVTPLPSQGSVLGNWYSFVLFASSLHPGVPVSMRDGLRHSSAISPRAPCPCLAANTNFLGPTPGLTAAVKNPFFGPSVKKTYLTYMCLTRVSTNVYRGFVPGKNLFRENVQNWAFVLKWPDEHTLLLNCLMEGSGGIHFTTKRTKGTKG